eukprot:CAMPEP_0184862816 /NCGR_PEP_ID=MMETSP0580-20130426/7922_1 /TAXON_ID=1118495 /ORGANISM="Dactyliosolen fragilissimus" /LENGTH=432 /DNA_ID=CAMNT_0027360811 /DNA_START=43 /DNA_END=1341 /DNA_ORIENTATION=-
MAYILRVVSAAPSRANIAAKREFSALVSTLEEFPSIPLTSPAPSAASTASVTKLPSGLTVVSENASSSSTISMTFPNAGSSSESASDVGAALVNKCLAFKSGSGLSSALIARSLEEEGATPFVTTGRMGATIGYTAPPDKASVLVPLLATNCSFEKWDVSDAIKLAGVEVEDAMSNAQTVLSESVFAAAYGPQSPMGRPFYSTGASAASIKSFRESAYVLSGAVLAATGIPDHGAFVQSVEEGLSEAAIGSSTEAPTPLFVGGESRIYSPSAGFAHVAFAFPAPSSGPLLDVIKKCLNLSSLDNISSFGSSGLLGVYSHSSPIEASTAVDAMCSVVTTNPSTEVVETAKLLAKAEAIFALDSGSKNLAGCMTTSVLANGTFDASAIAASYDSISAADVAKVFSSMAKTIPAVAAVGDIVNVPYQGTIAAKFS